MGRYFRTIKEVVQRTTNLHYRKATLRMSNALVRESMCYIHSTDACDIIRDCISDCDFIRNHELAAYVDMKLGKISGEEYRDIVLREDAD